MLDLFHLVMHVIVMFVVWTFSCVIMTIVCTVHLCIAFDIHVLHSGWSRLVVLWSSYCDDFVALTLSLDPFWFELVCNFSLTTFML